MSNKPKQEEQPNFYEELQEYFKNTPKEKILEDWNKSAELDKVVDVTVDEFLENLEKSLDDALAKETKESLTNWLSEKRNNS